VTNSLLFVLPDGRQAYVSTQSAHGICERLWALGVTPGAATAAVRIADALRARKWYGNDVAFTDREVAPLAEASRLDPPTWSQHDRATPHAIPVKQREHLLATCDELIRILDELGSQDKLRALVVDLERLRSSLRLR